MATTEALPDHYGVLELERSAEPTAIRQQYLRLSLRWHPDKARKGDDVTEVTARFQQICDAYSVLKDPATRRRYDTLTLLSAQTYPVDCEVDLDSMDYDEDCCEFRRGCRCTGAYVVKENELEKGLEIFGCSDCTLSIRVMYEEAVSSDDESGNGGSRIGGGNTGTVPVS